MTDDSDTDDGDEQDAVPTDSGGSSRRRVLAGLGALGGLATLAGGTIGGCRRR